MNNFLKLLVSITLTFILIACGGGGSGGGSSGISATTGSLTGIQRVGTALSYSPLTASGGNPPYTYSFTGTLPLGLNFDANTGVVSGTPASTYHGTVVFSVKDSNNVVASTTNSEIFLIYGTTVAAAGFIVTRDANSYTATRLPNGKVLVAGGMSNSTALSNAEIYDPATDNWTAVSNMNSATWGRAATLLPNGKVLVVGDTGGFYDSAELYDPVANTWTPTGSMPIWLSPDGAMLLSNGKVLATNGHDIALYDPTLNTWALGAANPYSGNSSSTVTLLQNGKVLVTGGWSFAGGFFAGTQLYDPATNTWAMAANLNDARADHTATLLANGKVLVTGGQYGDPSLVGLTSSELYDPATNTWTVVGNLAAGRYFHTATLLADGKVLVAEGDGARAGPVYPESTDGFELYDPTTETWAVAGALKNGGLGNPQCRHVATLLTSGNVLFTGPCSTEIH